MSIRTLHFLNQQHLPWHLYLGQETSWQESNSSYRQTKPGINSQYPNIKVQKSHALAKEVSFVRYNIQFKATHIRSIDNTKADSLSRQQLSRFRASFSNSEEEASVISPSFIQIIYNYISRALEIRHVWQYKEIVWHCHSCLQILPYQVEEWPPHPNQLVEFVAYFSNKQFSPYTDKSYILGIAYFCKIRSRLPDQHMRLYLRTFWCV